jgi:lysophospholipase L1-like esterase
MAQVAVEQRARLDPEASSLVAFVWKLGVAISIAVVLLAAGEASAYLLYRHRGEHNDQYQYQAYVVWRIEHPASPGISLDADGLRRTMSSHCEADNFTVWLFGASGLWGNQSRDSETIATWLAKRFEDTGRGACVRNFGQRGWASTQEVVACMLELKRARKKPDAVIFYDGSIDTYLPSETTQNDVHVGFDLLQRRFDKWRNGRGAGFEYLESTNTALLLEWTADHLGFRRAPKRALLPAAQVATLATQVRNNYLKNMELMEALGTHYGFQCVFVWEPWLVAADKPLTLAEKRMRDGYIASQPVVAQVMTAGYDVMRRLDHPHYFYLGDMFRGHPEALFVDHTHMNGEGNHLVAERLYQILQESSIKLP